MNSKLRRNKEYFGEGQEWSNRGARGRGFVTNPAEVRIRITDKYEGIFEGIEPEFGKKTGRKRDDAARKLIFTAAKKVRIYRR